MVVAEREFTAEQAEAIERRQGDLLLDAGAGSGKTSVLVERFVRMVLDDGIGVESILAITFTDKAAAELRERIRRRLRELGADTAARATETAAISTIHGFCARILRSGALTAGLDPAFVVLDRSEAELLADGAFTQAVEALASQQEGGVELIAAYGVPTLRGAILSIHDELRSRGHETPALPTVPPAPSGTDADAARDEVAWAAGTVAAELGAVPDPSIRVGQAIDRLAARDEILALPDPWPGELYRIALPGGNGAALRTPACETYTEALNRWRGILERRCAERIRALLDGLLRDFAARYAAAKRRRSGVDFDDLELIALRLLRDDELRDRLRERFAAVMVDEMQDTNPVQLELIESFAAGRLFTVGDAQQSIYGFRHADVSLFEARGRALAELGARATLQTNFRSRPEILAAINGAFVAELGEAYRPLRPGRVLAPAADPRVELLIADKGAEWDSDGLASPWRLAEARALARRLRALIADGARPGEIVVLTRASTDLRVYERALEDAGIPTYVIGGRGYWAHPQVIEAGAYLRALANPRDEEALFTVLISPIVRLAVGALVSLGAAARALGRDPWWLISDPDDALAGIDPASRRRLREFAAWFADERLVSPRYGVEELIERMLERTGYDLAVLAMAGGIRRLANVRKLMRLGREHEASAGRDLHGFLELVRRRTEGGIGGGDARDSEAPVEGEALDAARLMTIHRSKGLEFPIVCVADLGRAPMRRAEVIRVGRDGRLGIRLAEPGTGRAENALHLQELADEQFGREQEEERRLFYVAMTRAEERLILSGASKLETIGQRSTPMEWIAPAFVPDVAARVEDGSGVSEAGVAYAFVRPEDEWAAGGDNAPPPAQPTPEEAALQAPTSPGPPPSVPGPPPPVPVPPPSVPGPPPPVPVPPPSVPVPPPPVPAPPPAFSTVAEAAPPVTSLSYSALAAHDRCGYRFYAERVLGLPPTENDDEPGSGGDPAGGLTAAARGVLIHAVLQRLDLRRPVLPDGGEVTRLATQLGLRPTTADAEEAAAMVIAYAGSSVCARLAAATDVRREQRFAFELGRGVLVTGALDVLAREPEQALVVDYKSDRLGDATPQAIVEGEYATQRLIYALAALRSGAAAVEVLYVFLERPDRPVSQRFVADDAKALAETLTARAQGILRARFGVSDSPRRAVCRGCPAEGGLCSWPLAMTRRQSADQLF
jgi:ATP-dependent helicase/nuclease subunit A